MDQGTLISDERKAHQEVILAAIDSYDGVFSATGPVREKAKRRIENGKDEEVAAIALAILSDPDNFKGALLKDLFKEEDLLIVSTVATVYSPDIHPGRSRHFRLQALKTAYVQYVAVDEAYFESGFHHTEYSDLVGDNSKYWEIATRSEMLKERARRCVAMYCELTPKHSAIKRRLTEMMLDEKRTDHYFIIDFLRANRDNSITLEQLEFVASGGTVAVSGGVL